MENMNETREILIEDISDQGHGIGRIDNVVVFVEDALPGDLAEIKIIEKKKNFYKAKTVNIIKKSEFRVEPKCKYSKECGGCPYMDLVHYKQRNLKAITLKNKIERIGGFHNIEYEDLVDDNQVFYYRNKTEFVVGKDLKIGFHKQKSKETVDVKECVISAPTTNILLECLRKNIHPRLGIKKMTVRYSFASGEIMIIFWTENKNKDDFTSLIMEMDKTVKGIKVWANGDKPSLESVYLYNEKKKNKSYILVAGKRTINDSIMGMTFEISPASFYQTNPFETISMFRKVKEYANPGPDTIIYDLYCGVGTIGLTLASEAKEVIGIESVKDAVLDANRNAVINGIINARYIHGKAEELMDTLDMGQNSVIVVDPPRAGLRQEVINAIGESKSTKIVYVSCDAGTFSRDAKNLSEFGFDLKKITPIDMFPQTAHLETVALLTR